MQYEFNALEVGQNDCIVINLPNNVCLNVSRGDYGYSVDFTNTDTSTIFELGWASDDDLDLIEEEEE